jgi:hypothetical protein
MRRRVTVLLLAFVAAAAIAFGGAPAAKANPRCFWLDLPPLPRQLICLPV